MTPVSQTLLNLADGSQVVLGAESAPRSQPAALNGNLAARQASLTWLQSAMSTVSAVYPWVQWGAEIAPALSDEFDLALEERFWTGAMDQDAFMAVWRRWYGAHL